MFSFTDSSTADNAQPLLVTLRFFLMKTSKALCFEKQINIIFSWCRAQQLLNCEALTL